MRISQNGIDFIKRFEGCRLTAYKPVPTEKYYTIGIGHYGADVVKGMTITQARADELFRNDIKPIESLLNNMHINFTQGQFDSLLSWVFNLGSGNFNSSTMKKRILSNANDVAITDEMIRWTRSSGRVLSGLVRRRCEEANMFLGRNVYYIDGLTIKKH